MDWIMCATRQRGFMLLILSCTMWSTSILLVDLLSMWYDATPGFPKIQGNIFNLIFSESARSWKITCLLILRKKPFIIILMKVQKNGYKLYWKILIREVPLALKITDQVQWHLAMTILIIWMSILLIHFLISKVMSLITWIIHIHFLILTICMITKNSQGSRIKLKYY